ncbi:hypothetical protein HTZ77_37175 [Nonomuraea sp. SMC257]|uniref:Uncharacterized protein n=1 Tax=Nonomuraea montanisoli TaxID=2741721 RepID=A0A7Y6M7T4_9ACTN|nr:hypothetical protein [Nonomuraea montanisoli]NUW36995.1 hypothetical protein [Nonomuraea montanisoli]
MGIEGQQRGVTEHVISPPGQGRTPPTVGIDATGIEALSVAGVPACPVPFMCGMAVIWSKSAGASGSHGMGTGRSGCTSHPLVEASKSLTGSTSSTMWHPCGKVISNSQG